MSVPERRVRRLELKADAHKKRRLKRHVQLAITLDLRPEYLAKKYASRPPSFLAPRGRRRPRLVHWLELYESNPPVPQSAIDVVTRIDDQSIVRSDAGSTTARTILL